MVRQSLVERAAVIAIDELDGRVSVRDGRDLLKAKGLLPAESDLLEEAELEYTRSVFRMSERYNNREETGKFGWAHLSERLEDGTRADYYKKIEQTTVDEAVQDLIYWHKTSQTYVGRLRQRFKDYCKVHGKRKIQRKLPFDIPDDEPVEV